jgi:AbrB family looped-hinge helix DNA binding protein
MDTVTISPKYQVVIPKAIRAQLKLRAGQKVQAIAYQNRIELVPVRPARQMRGFLKGINTDVPRDRDRV